MGKGEAKVEKAAEPADPEKGRKSESAKENQPEKGAQKNREVYTESARKVEQLVEVEKQGEAELKTESTKGQIIEEMRSIGKKRNI